MANECRVRSGYRDKVDTRSDRVVARLAAAQWGVLSLDELLACGLTLPGVSRRVQNGRLHPLHRGVYAVGHPNTPLLGRFLAAVKACGPHAALSHLSAAAVHHIITWEDRYPEVTAPAKHAHRGLRVHRAFLAAHEITHHGPLPLTTPTRTLIDLAATLPEPALRRAVRHAQAHGLTTPRRLATTQRRGAATLRRIIATGPASTRSALEDAVLDLILAAGFAQPDVNLPLVINGRRVIPDFRWPRERLIVEADGVAYHAHQREDDAHRQALLEAHGERVIRVTWAQAVTHRNQTVARLRAAGAPRLSRS